MSTLSQFFGSKPNPLDFTLGNTKQLAAGGINICYQGTGVLWVVAPSQSEVSRTWYNRNDASTRAQAVTGCTTWFVPTQSQLANPGYTCRTYWDSYSATNYWADTAATGGSGDMVSFVTGQAFCYFKTNSGAVRAFRCVTY
jgi:hypothetical protein